jgi:secreted trypsin-like serine protease
MIDGGPSCFGDSGGPFWRMVANPEGTQTPVLVGVFSFMLWGTCIGRNEPGYYGRVSDHLEWINQYIPKNQVCTFSTKFKDRQPS